MSGCRHDKVETSAHGGPGGRRRQSAHSCRRWAEDVATLPDIWELPCLATGHQRVGGRCLPSCGFIRFSRRLFYFCLIFSISLSSCGGGSLLAKPRPIRILNANWISLIGALHHFMSSTSSSSRGSLIRITSSQREEIGNLKYIAFFDWLISCFSVIGEHQCLT
jgi:hypothetical protein